MYGITFLLYETSLILAYLGLVSYLAFRFLRNLPNLVDYLMREQIQKILNDKELFDSLKNYAQGITNGVLKGSVQKVKLQDVVLAGAMKYFTGGQGNLLGTLFGNNAENPTGNEQTSIPGDMVLSKKGEKNKINPFSK